MLTGRCFDVFRGRRIERLRRRPLGRYRYVRLRWRVLFAVIDFVGAILFGAARAARSLAERLVGRRAASPAGVVDNPRTILLIQLDHLGDAVITTVMLPLLRERYPHASIEVLASRAGRELFEACAEVDRVHVARLNRFERGGRLGWPVATFCCGWKLRRRNVDLGIDVRGDFPAALVLWLSGARRRLGWHCGGGGFLLTDTVGFVHRRPEAASRLALLDRLGIRPSTVAQPWRPAFRPSGAARRRTAEMLDELGCNSTASAPLLVVHVGAGTLAKQWPVEHWRELIGRIVARREVQIVLVGGQNDRSKAGRIARSTSLLPVVDLAGRLGVDDLTAVIESADLFVGADSGPAHLASAVGTPGVVLFSGTNSARQWRPRGSAVRVVRNRVACSPCHRQRCPLAGHPCMLGLEPGRVAEAVDGLLDQLTESATDGSSETIRQCKPDDVSGSGSVSRGAVR